MTQRRASDHVHPDYWTEVDQHRYEDRMTDELRNIRREVKSLGDRVLMMMGAIALLAFAVPLLAPFIRNLFGVGG